MKIGKVDVVLIVLTVACAAFAVLGYLDKATLEWDGTLLLSDSHDEKAVVVGNSMEINMTGARNIETYTVFVILSTIGAYTLVSELYARRVS